MTDMNSFDDIHNVKYLQFHYHHLRIGTVLYVAYENAELQQGVFRESNYDKETIHDFGRREMKETQKEDGFESRFHLFS